MISPTELNKPDGRAALERLFMAQSDAYDRWALPLGVVHFGPGAFFRAHQADVFDRMNAFDPRFGIGVIALNSRRSLDVFDAQDGLYVLSIRDQMTRNRAIGAIRQWAFGPEDRAVAEAMLTTPTVGYVTATITEKGYGLTPEGNLDLERPDIQFDLAHPDAPCTFLGWVLRGLKLRRERNLAPFVVLSCDNIARNGHRVREALIALARASDPDLAEWVSAEVCVPNTMVDAITPATDTSLCNTVFRETGCNDEWPIQREAFSQWVIESHKGGLDPAPDWARAGVQVCDSLEPFARAKLWVLNGAHSALAYGGLLRGYATVTEAAEDPELRRSVQSLMMDSVLPLLEPLPGLALEDYARQIWARFENPELAHQLAQIAWDGSQKIPVRILDPMMQACVLGRDPTPFAAVIGTWLAFIRMRSEGEVALVDPQAEDLLDWASRSRTDLDPVGEAFATLALFRAIPADLEQRPQILECARKHFADSLATQSASPISAFQ